MNFAKPPLTFEQQADLLLKRGMAGDRDLIIARLASVNYYRLSGYWYPFRQVDPNDASHPLDDFKPGTTFEHVWMHYVFDRRLRLLVMDAIERIEVAVRAQLCYHHAHEHGAVGYATDANALPKLDANKLKEFIDRVTDETTKSKENFVDHFQAKYGDPHLPVWMATEIMTFGSVLTLFNGSSHKVKQKVATTFGMPDVVFASWLLTLNSIRNICAHHSRLWNRELGVKPIIPRIKEYPDWHTPVKVQNNRMFSVLTVCRHCLSRIAPQSNWALRLQSLLDDFPQIQLYRMDFPDNWKQCPIWASAFPAPVAEPKDKGVDDAR